MFFTSSGRKADFFPDFAHSFRSDRDIFKVFDGFSRNFGIILFKGKNVLAHRFRNSIWGMFRFFRKREKAFNAVFQGETNRFFSKNMW